MVNRTLPYFFHFTVTQCFLINFIDLCRWLTSDGRSRRRSSTCSQWCHIRAWHLNIWWARYGNNTKLSSVWPRSTNPITKRQSSKKKFSVICTGIIFRNITLHFWLWLHDLVILILINHNLRNLFSYYLCILSNGSFMTLHRGLGIGTETETQPSWLT